ncbi:MULTISPECIES: heme acquisition protein HasA [Pseudomonas]|uniref:Heme acquisition protein HasA n=1 Tax=Pseudomonas fakonensis TaxID=2842355 RepID=A0ABX8N3C7_9PSED|nr:heme acquisition protein HasA [Pseudomonas fakonensis]QXH50851.1 heme acquisition protein HasA [Pseudomonas fakonensis]
MTLSVNYAATFANVSVDSYLAFWSTSFKTADHGSSNTGGFSNGTFSGDQYAISGSGSSYAFIADSDTSNGLNYVFNPALPASSTQNHYLWGELDNVSLGQQLGGGGGSDYSLSNFVVTFGGLDLSSALGDGRVAGANDVHDVIYGLMQGNTSALESVLDNLLADYGVSTNNTFADISAALAAGPVSTVSADAVGVQALPEDLALAA